MAKILHFQEVSSNKIKIVLKPSNKKISLISPCIPVKVDSADTDLFIFTDIIHNSIRNGISPEWLKLVEVTPLFLKKADPFEKVNYRPVGLLLHVSNVSEINIFNQVSAYFQQFFSLFAY